MRKEEIIAKGSYVHPQLADLISVKQYIITKIKGKKALLLRLSNDRDEVATALTLRIRQYNVKGEFIGAEKLVIKKQNISPLSVFALNKPIILNDNCIEFRVDVVNASYGDYTYDVIEGEAHIRYVKETDEDADKVNTSQLTLDLGGKKQRVAVRTLKAPALLVAMCSILLFVVMCFTIAQIARYMYVETCFTLDNFEYEFMTDNKDDGPIRLTKYNGDALNLVIPAEIEGYPIASIAEGTFSNSRIRSITIQGNTVIEANAFKNCRRLETVSIANVTEIHEDAFMNCKSLTTVTIGNNLAHIGKNGFSGCYKLRSINLPEGLVTIGDYAFKSCTSLDTLVIPKTTVSIGTGIIKGCNIESLTVPFIGKNENDIETLSYLYGVSDNIDVSNSLLRLCVTNQDNIINGAFADCASLVSVEFNEQVKYIGDNAFSGCVNLSEFDIDSTVEYIGSFAFNDCQSLDGIALPEGIETVFESTFNNCTSLSGITIPESVTRVNRNAFNNCRSLKTLVVPANVVAIEEGAFADCISLIEVSIPYIGYSMDEPMNMSAVFGDEGAKSIQVVRVTGAESICDEAFKDMTSLRMVYLNGDITRIGDSAFENCSSLKKVTMFEGIEEIGERAFYGCSSIDSIDVPNGIQVIKKGQFEGCSSLVYITIPETVTEIEDNAFSGCSSLTEIILPEEITSIGENAFADCQSLDSISIPAKVTEIKTGTFDGCSSLTIVAIPSTVTAINERAFAGCSSLSGIALPNALTVIGNEAFADCVSLRTFTLPATVTELGAGILSGCTSIYSLSTHIMTPSISETGESGCIGYLFDPTNADNSTVPESLNIVTLTGISIISENAFAGCVGLTGINMPISITSIEKNAFMGCVSLNRVIIPESITVIKEGTFKDCVSLETVSIPRKLVEIEDEAFMGCSSLANIKLHDKLTVIGDYAFAGCSLLGEVTIPFTVEYIGFASFYDCDALKSLTIPYIGSMIDDSESLIYIFGDESPESLETINLTGGDAVKDSAFENITSVKTINLHENIVSIGTNAFAGCASLESLVIPNSVTYIGDDILENCDSIVSLTAPFLGESNADSYTLDDFFAQNVPQSLKSVKLTNADYISNYAFYGLESLEEVVIEGSAINVGYQAFYGCVSLKKVVLPETLTSIGQMAFAECRSLGSIRLPSDLSSIGYSAFYNCFRLYEIYNHSAYFTVTPGAGSNGDVGYFALAVFLDGETSEKVYLDGFTFLKNSSSDEWYLVEYSLEDGICTLPDSIETDNGTVYIYSIPQNLFRDNTSLIEIYMSEAIQAIGANVFLNCTSLAVADISETQIDEIPASAFMNCESLLAVDIPDTVSIIAESAFQNCYLLATVNMPSNLISIGSQAFMNCNELVSIELPSGTEIINDYAFYGCYSLETFVTSPVLSTIGYYSFYNCSSLRSITIGENVSYIGSEAFLGCNSLREVYNLSWLSISPEDSANGYVAYYAYIVHNSADAQPLHDVEIGNLNFMKSDDSWFLVGHHSEDGELVFESFTYQGKLVDSYVIVRDAFVDDEAIVSIQFLDDTVKTIGMNAFGNQSSLESVDFIYNSALDIDDISWVASYTGITYIGFPTTLTEFPKEIIDELYNLKSISFEGNNNITVIPENAFYNRNKIESVVLPNSTVEIGSYAFYNCNALNNLLIPEGLTRIGFWSFYRCSSLKTVSLPTSLESIDNYAFQGSGLTEIYIPQNVSYMGGGVFYGCYYLVSADLSDAYSLNYISSTMFAQCYDLCDIKLPSWITEIHENAFIYCQSLESIAIPESVYLIGDSAFANCTMLGSVELNSSLQYIYNNAFYNCPQLLSIVIPQSVISIGNYAFGECYSLNSVIIYGCETIGEYAFANCAALEDVEFPSNLRVIDRYAFYDCDSIESLDFSNCYNLNSIGAYAFNNCSELTYVEFYRCSSIAECAFQNCISLETVIFPYNIQSIGEYSFDGCVSLTNVDLSSSTLLYDINYGVFRGCLAVEELVLPSNLRNIYSNAFNGCTSLSSLTIPSSVRNIEYDAFYNCQNIREVWNLSSLRISVGDTSYGYAAYYAIAIHNKASDSPLGYYENVVDGVTYKFAYDPSTGTIYLWGAENYDRDTMFVFPTADGSSYTVSRLLSEDVSFDTAFMSLDVNYIEVGFLDSTSYSTIYFYGTESDWYLRTNSAYWYGTLYTFVECKHDYSNTWTYNENNAISTEISELSYEIVYDSTCFEYGLGRYVCVECDQIVSSETISLKPHVDGGNGTCGECGIDLTYRNVISSLLTSNDSYFFEFNSEDELVSNNSTVGGSSAITVFTADRKMNVTIHYSVSSESSFDYLYIIRNGSETLDKISGSVSEKELTVTLNEGDTLTFNYSKDGSVDSYNDCATIHRITIESID